MWLKHCKFPCTGIQICTILRITHFLLLLLETQEWWVKPLLASPTPDLIQQTECGRYVQHPPLCVNLLRICSWRYRQTVTELCNYRFKQFLWQYNFSGSKTRQSRGSHSKLGREDTLFHWEWCRGPPLTQSLFCHIDSQELPCAVTEPIIIYINTCVCVLEVRYASLKLIPLFGTPFWNVFAACLHRKLEGFLRRRRRLLKSAGFVHT